MTNLVNESLTSYIQQFKLQRKLKNLGYDIDISKSYFDGKNEARIINVKESITDKRYPVYLTVKIINGPNIGMTSSLSPEDFKKIYHEK